MMVRTLRKFSRLISGRKGVKVENPKEVEKDTPYERIDFYEHKQQEMMASFSKNRTLYSGTNDTIKISDHFYKNVDVKIAGSVPNVYDSGQSFIEYVEEIRPSTIIIGMANPETLEATKGKMTRHALIPERAHPSIQFRRCPCQRTHSEVFCPGLSQDP